MIFLQPDSNNDESSSRQRPWEKSNTLPHKLGANSNSSNSNSNNTGNGSESPKPLRKRFGSASEETILKVCATLSNFSKRKFFKFCFFLVQFIQAASEWRRIFDSECH